MCVQVKCTLTGHEMPLKPDIIKLYTSSRRYTNMLDFHMCPYYQKYKQFFTDCNSKKRKYIISLFSFSFEICCDMLTVFS